LTGTKAPAPRRLARASARATISLPVPRSPRISTVASVGATRAIVRPSARIPGLRLMIPSGSPAAARGRGLADPGISPDRGEHDAHGAGPLRSPERPQPVALPE